MTLTAIRAAERCREYGYDTIIIYGTVERTCKTCGREYVEKESHIECSIDLGELALVYDLEEPLEWLYKNIFMTREKKSSKYDSCPLCRRRFGDRLPQYNDYKMWLTLKLSSEGFQSERLQSKKVEDLEFLLYGDDCGVEKLELEEKFKGWREGKWNIVKPEPEECETLEEYAAELEAQRAFFDGCREKQWKQFIDENGPGGVTLGENTPPGR